MPGQQKHGNVFGAMPEGASGIAPNIPVCFFSGVKVMTLKPSPIF